MKKLLSVLLTFVLLLCFVSCGNKDTEKLKKENEELEEKLEKLEEEFEELKASDTAETSASGANAEVGVPDEKVYKIALDNAYRPFSFFDEEKQEYVGIDVELAEAIAKDQGFKYTICFGDFTSALTQVREGQADIIANVAITEERQKTLDFSDVYFLNEQALYGFAVKKGENAELIEMFNKGLRNIKENGKYAEILAKYGIMS